MRYLVLGMVLLVGSWLAALPADARPGPGGGVRPGQADPDMRQRRYLFAGKLVSASAFQLEVSGKGTQGKEGTMRFQVAQGVAIPQGLQPGDQVVVDYAYTIENGVYQAMAVRKLAPGQRPPQNTFPDQR